MYDTNVEYNVNNREKPRTTKESSKCKYYRDKIISIASSFLSDVGETSCRFTRSDSFVRERFRWIHKHRVKPIYIVIIGPTVYVMQQTGEHIR